MTVFTIHNIISEGRFGLESTHAYRQSVFDKLYVSHVVIYTEIFNIDKGNWLELLEDRGITSSYHVILDQSDIARDKPCVTTIDLFPEGVPNGVKIYFTREGYVGLVLHESGLREYYTSSKFLEVNDMYEFKLYGQSGLVMSGELTDTGDYKTSIGRSQTELLLDYLVEQSTSDSVFILDHNMPISGKIKRFFTVTNRCLYRMIHYNALLPHFKYTKLSWTQTLVASEWLSERLSNSIFIPPVALESVAPLKHYDGITRWCLVGNSGKIKRSEWAIEAFRLLPDVTLTIFGELPEGVGVDDLPFNITFAGNVEFVPYEEFEGYISCSETELFANAMVEASSKGLCCLVSNTDVAHKRYASMDENVVLFDDQESLLSKLKELRANGGVSATFSKNYKIESVLPIFEQLLRKG